MDVVKVLSDRAEVVKAELIKARDKVTELTQALQEAQAHLQAVSGHFNEVGYLLTEAQKQVPQDDSKELVDGQVNSEEAK